MGARPFMRSEAPSRIEIGITLISHFRRFRYEPISHATDSQQMFRLGRIVFNVTPQTHDEIIYRASVSVFMQSPDFFQNCFARNNSAAVANQMTQQFRFHQSKLDRVPLDSQFELAKIDDSSVE